MFVGFPVYNPIKANFYWKTEMFPSVWACDQPVISWLNEQASV